MDTIKSARAKLHHCSGECYHKNGTCPNIDTCDENINDKNNILYLITGIITIILSLIGFIFGTIILFYYY